MAATASNASLSKAAGISIMVGPVLLLLAGIFYPGGALIDPADQTDFEEALASLGANASLAHLTAIISSLGMLLYGYGFFTLFRLLQKRGSLSDVVLRFGIVTSMFGWGIFIVAMGMRHGAVHFMQRSEIASGAQAEAAVSLALACHAITVAMAFAFMTIFPVGSALTGIGLAPRFSAMNVFKLACYGLVVVGVAGLVNFHVAKHAPDISVDALLVSTNLILLIGSAFLFIIGMGLLQGRSELSAEDSSG